MGQVVVVKDKPVMTPLGLSTAAYTYKVVDSETGLTLASGLTSDEAYSMARARNQALQPSSSASASASASTQSSGNVPSGPVPLTTWNSSPASSSQTSNNEQQQQYATQIMDTAVQAGLEHQKWVEQQQENLLDTYKAKMSEENLPSTSDLMQAGTAEIMRSQQQALHTVSSSLAAKGLLGSSAAESAYAKVAGETASQIGVLAAETQKQLLETQTARETSYITAMNQLLSIPTLQGYQQLGAAGANASLFALPTMEV